MSTPVRMVLATRAPENCATMTAQEAVPKIAVALLTGGGDKPYAFGLATELMSKGAVLDVIGGNDLDCPEFQNKPGVNFLNLRGDQRTDVSLRKEDCQGIKILFKADPLCRGRQAEECFTFCGTINSNSSIERC